MHNKNRDIGWAAGLFDADGCITFNAGRARVELGMTDIDLVEDFAELMPGGHHSVDPRSVENKIFYRYTIRSRDAVKDALQRMLPFLGQRRTVRAYEALESIEESRLNWPNAPMRRRSIPPSLEELHKIHEERLAGLTLAAIGEKHEFSVSHISRLLKRELA
jgi:hypothetical protein